MLTPKCYLILGDGDADELAIGYELAMFWLFMACMGDWEKTSEDTVGEDTSALQGEEGQDAVDRMDPSELPAAPSPCREPVLVEVVDVIDGDTIWVQTSTGSERVRFIGVDAPEMSDGGECYGAEATDEVRSGLQGFRVWLTFDSECEDHYGRTLAYVHRAPNADGFLQRWLLRGGWVETLEVSPNTAFAEEFGADMQAARSAGAGLWSACD